MSQVIKSVLVPYTAPEMFELVDRIEAYTEFLPWCGGTELHRRDEAVTEATIHIRYMHVQQHFTTENLKQYPEAMHLTLKDGPFRKLEGAWRFKPLGEEGSRVELLLHYEFSSQLLEKVVGPVFALIANSLVDAFVHRAEKVYGAR